LIKKIKNPRKIFRVFLKEPFPTKVDGIYPADKIAAGKKYVVHLQKISVNPADIIEALHIYKQTQRMFNNGFPMVYLAAVYNSRFSLDDTCQIQRLIKEIKHLQRIIKVHFL